MTALRTHEIVPRSARHARRLALRASLAFHRLGSRLGPRARALPLRQILAISAGAALAGAAINALHVANGLVEGGVTGIAVLLKLTAGADPGLVSLTLNLPLLYLGWRRLGGRAMGLTVYGTLCLSLSLSAFGWLRLPLSDLLLVSLLAGAAVGLGFGLIFRVGGTTGGVDIVARIAHQALGWPLGRTLFVADLLVLSVSVVYLDLQRALYTLVAVFVAGRVIDLMQDSAHAALSVTQVEATGGFTGQRKAMLWVVVSPRELVALKRIVATEDPGAFVSLAPVREVVGEGFQPAG